MYVHVTMQCLSNVSSDSSALPKHITKQILVWFWSDGPLPICSLGITFGRRGLCSVPEQKGLPALFCHSGHTVSSAQFAAALTRSSSLALSKVPTALKSKASPLLVCTVSPCSESSPMLPFTLPQMGHFPKYAFLIFHPSSKNIQLSKALNS